MKTIIKGLTKLLRHPAPKSQPPKANCPKPTANCEQPTANSQQPTADPTVLVNLFLTLSSD